jgi:hypothetical protein
LQVNAFISRKEEPMVGQGTVTDQILEFVKAHPNCTLDEVTLRLQEWNWSEVFIEVDRLNRLGRLRLVQTSAGYVTTLSAL